MAKGLFSQGICVLFENAPKLDAIEDALKDFSILKRVDSQANWEMSGPSLVISFLPEVNGLVTVDVVDRQWPDSMGDPQKNPEVFAAWSMAHFGPFAFPDGLKRAAEQSWSWPAGKEMPSRHQAFVRVRISYVFGGNDDLPILPKEYDPKAELNFVSKVVLALLEIPGALCYYNPNGELLLSRDLFGRSLTQGWSNDFLPIDAWANVRVFNLSSEWSLMDTVGNAQLDLPDMEACFHAPSYDLEQIVFFLRNVTLYVANRGEVIKDDDTMDGPGNVRWTARSVAQSICEPPRRVLRWAPVDERELPAEFEVPDAE